METITPPYLFPVKIVARRVYANDHRWFYTVQVIMTGKIFKGVVENYLHHPPRSDE
jgi:hypothetical protein